MRLLRTPDTKAVLGENGLRVDYQPVWNAVLTGFDGNEPGSSTRKSARTMWDTVHEGRNRSYGESPDDREKLIERAQEHIVRQVVNIANAPWRD